MRPISAPHSNDYYGKSPSGVPEPEVGAADKSESTGRRLAGNAKKKEASAAWRKGTWIEKPYASLPGHSSRREKHSQHFRSLAMQMVRPRG